jgi:hypothetical protein
MGSELQRERQQGAWTRNRSRRRGNSIRSALWKHFAESEFVISPSGRVRPNLGRKSNHKGLSRDFYYFEGDFIANVLLIW